MNDSKDVKIEVSENGDVKIEETKRKVHGLTGRAATLKRKFDGMSILSSMPGSGADGIFEHELIRRLNVVIEAEPALRPAIKRLIEQRIEVSEEVANSAFVTTVRKTEDGETKYYLGLLGLFNALTAFISVEVMDEELPMRFMANMSREDKELKNFDVQAPYFTLSAEGPQDITDPGMGHGWPENVEGKDVYTVMLQHLVPNTLTYQNLLESSCVFTRQMAEVALRDGRVPDPPNLGLLPSDRCMCCKKEQPYMLKWYKCEVDGKEAVVPLCLLCSQGDILLSSKEDDV